MILGERRSHRPDYLMALGVFALLAVGLILMYSVSPILSHRLSGNVDRNYYFYNQLKYVVIGLVAWLVATSVSYERWRRLAPILMLAAIMSLLALLVPGLRYSQNGATRWLNLGIVTFQPAELLKLALVVYLASWLERRGQEVTSLIDGVMPFAFMLIVACFVIVVWQRDMGTMMVVALLALGMYYVAGIRLTHLAVVLGGGIAAGWAAILTAPHRLDRLASFLDPTRDATGTGYHISQALIAVGSGGLFGVGLGHSLAVYGYLPEASNDSVFAVIAEEFGFIGSLALVALYGFVIWRGIKVARTAPDTYSRLLATGITIWLLSQAIINIAAMLSLVPLTGIPLPFISYGGTSLIVTLVAVGILQNISKYTVMEVHDANSRQWGRNGRPHYANSSGRRRPQIAR